MRGGIEVLFVPVRDPDRAKAFWVDRLGFRLDQDTVVGSGVRYVQVTPEGSACSLAFGTDLSPMEPGTLRAAMLVVQDVETARAELLEAGAEPTEIEEQPWGRFVYFADPDGNRFWLQELPGRS